MSNKQILIVSSELAGVAPAGGLAEYTLGLARALADQGHDVRVAMPAYHFALKALNDVSTILPRLVVSLGPGFSEVTSVRVSRLSSGEAGKNAVTIYLLCDHPHFASVDSPKDIYAWPNHEPWTVFSRAVVAYLQEANAWWPEIVLSQDAHSAMVLVYLRQLREQQPNARLANSIKVLTVHNLAYQGCSKREIVKFSGLDDSAFDTYGFEYWGQANPFKAGMLAADTVTTVSRTYADEICRGEEVGFGLSGVFRDLAKSGRLVGIVNGIDLKRWSFSGYEYPLAPLPELRMRRRQVRENLFRRFGWPAGGDPVIAVRCRWDQQKGVDLLVDALPRLTTGARLLISCWGGAGEGQLQQGLWQRLAAFAQAHPDRVLVNPIGITRPEESADHYAGSDLLLMPSRYEPCGLTQIECQRYGCIPVVRQTGGLRDTVLDGSNGFCFEPMTEEALVEAVDRALRTMRDEDAWDAVVRSAVTQANGWETRIVEYEALFNRLTH